MVYSTRQFVLSLALCYFVLVFFSPFSIAITSLGVKRANLCAFRIFVRFILVWFCLFLFLLVSGKVAALTGLFSYLFCIICLIWFEYQISNDQYDPNRVR